MTNASLETFFHRYEEFFMRSLNGEIDFHVHYLMQERDGNLRIFGWISGDEQGLLREYGIID